MMEWTDRHCRFFHRLLTRRALIYTEMVTTGAVLRGDRERLIGFDPAEHPVALQLGGSGPVALASCARNFVLHGRDRKHDMEPSGNRVYFGTELGSYPNFTPLSNPGLATFVVDQLTPATWYFALTAVNASGIESTLSNVGMKVVR